VTQLETVERLELRRTDLEAKVGREPRRQPGEQRGQAVEREQDREPRETEERDGRAAGADERADGLAAQALQELADRLLQPLPQSLDAAGARVVQHGDGGLRQSGELPLRDLRLPRLARVGLGLLRGALETALREHAGEQFVEKSHDASPGREVPPRG
jgi:hypothetical protein